MKKEVGVLCSDAHSTIKKKIIAKRVLDDYSTFEYELSDVKMLKVF